MSCVEGTFSELIEFFVPNLIQIYFCILEMSKLKVLNMFFSTKTRWNLGSCVTNSQKLFCSQKTVVKYS